MLLLVDVGWLLAFFFVCGSLRVAFCGLRCVVCCCLRFGVCSCFVCFWLWVVCRLLLLCFSCLMLFVVGCC